MKRKKKELQYRITDPRIEEEAGAWEKKVNSYRTW